MHLFFLDSGFRGCWFWVQGVGCRVTYEDEVEVSRVLERLRGGRRRLQRDPYGVGGMGFGVRVERLSTPLAPGFSAISAENSGLNTDLWVLPTNYSDPSQTQLPRRAWPASVRSLWCLGFRGSRVVSYERGTPVASSSSQG